ncbi:MAG TPA: ABC transporter permease [Gemmatimonadaceae bacterium]|nr:ABC transporter permease [Gemmatimonadaceae bacterium]
MSDEHAPHAHRAATWRRYLRFWGPRAEADVDDELRFHIEMRVREFMARGMSESQARDATARRLGDLATNRAECVSITTRRERRMTRAQLIDAFGQDVSFAFRTLGRQKGWTAVAILTLALGIGANTAVFSVVNSLLLHPLSYPHADRVAILYEEPTQGNTTGMLIMVSPRPSVVRAWRESSRAFEDIEPYTSASMTLVPPRGEAATIQTASILPSFMRFTGEHPLIGRAFTAGDLTEGGHVAMVSEAMWRSRYAGDAKVIGQTLSLDGSLYTIIGVMPATASLPARVVTPTDVWLPLDMHNDHLGLSTIARLRPGMTYAVAQRDLDSISTRVDRAEKAKMQFHSKLMTPRQMVGFGESLLLLSGAVALVLLIACANVAHLFLARAASRQRELAIRAALGAGSGRLVRQLLTESLVLAAAGCAGGVLIGWVGLKSLIALRPGTLTELDSARIDLTTLLVTIALSVLTGLLFGTVGAIQSARHSTHESLKAGTLTTSHSRRQNRLRGLLVVSEIALSATLLVGASLLVRSVMRLQMMDAGFSARGLYGMTIVLPEKSYATPAARRAFYAELTARARVIGGVETAMMAEGAPPSMSLLIGALQIEGDAAPAAGTTAFVDYNGVQPSYFRAMGIRLIEGTTFSDTTDKSNQVIVNEGLAIKYFRGKSPLGHRLRVVFNGTGDWMTIIGVAANAFTSGLTMDASDPLLYVPFQGRYNPALLVRSKPGANPMATVRSLVPAIDRNLPPPTITSVEDAMGQSIATPRFTMMLLAAFTVLALVLAAVGLYGVLAYTVTQRTREIGIRMALGATRRAIGRAVMTQGAMLAVSGIVVGMAGAFWATKFIDKMLYGVPRSDPYSFAVGALLLLATAMLACLIPMRRAVAVDPLVAMKAE